MMFWGWKFAWKSRKFFSICEVATDFLIICSLTLLILFYAAPVSACLLCWQELPLLAYVWSIVSACKVKYVHLGLAVFNIWRLLQLPTIVSLYHQALLHLYLHFSRRSGISICWTTAVEQPSVQPMTVWPYPSAVPLGINGIFVWLTETPAPSDFLFVVCLLTYLLLFTEDGGRSPRWCCRARSKSSHSDSTARVKQISVCPRVKLRQSELVFTSVDRCRHDWCVGKPDGRNAVSISLCSIYTVGDILSR